MSHTAALELINAATISRCWVTD